MCALKMKFLASVVQKLQPEQIHRHTHTDSTEITTYMHARMVIIFPPNSFIQNDVYIYLEHITLSLQ